MRYNKMYLYVCICINLGRKLFQNLVRRVFSLFRPVLMRAETIDSCCSDDLVTVLEVDKRQKRPFKITDRLRIYRKGVMAGSLKELIQKGKKLFFYKELLVQNLKQVMRYCTLLEKSCQSPIL